MFISRCVKCFVFTLTTSIVFTSIPLSSISANTLIESKNRTTNNATAFRSIENSTYKADVKTLNQWSGHSNMEICFTNLGKETIHDWIFTFDFDYAIENPYNCKIVEHKDNLYTIANRDWNQDILPGKSITIGFTAASSDGKSIEKNPSFYLLNTKTIKTSSKDLNYKYEQYSDWKSGFNGAIVLTNKSNESIRDWTITFKTNRVLTKADSAVLKANSNGTYTISNDGSNQNISKNQKYTIGIHGDEHDANIPFEISGFTGTSRKLAIRLNEDKNKNGIADVCETDYGGAITVTPTRTPKVTLTVTPTATMAATSKPTATPTAIATPTITATSTATATPTVTETPTGTTIPTTSLTPTVTATPTASVTPTWDSNEDDYTDSDSDGLTDALEVYFGTDKDKADTDSDGVYDYAELVLGTDPNIPDDNANSDFDLDGLTNAQESKYGTNPKSKDTDIDGLPDGEEIKLYGTNPLKYDTDDDDISDSDEIHLGSNPKLSDSNVERYQTKSFSPSNNSELKGVVEVTVSGYITGSMKNNTIISDIYGKDLQTTSIEALVGNPISIESTGSFSSMTITFKYSDNLNENDLRIMWFDEENCDYVVLDNYTINTSSNTISVTTSHFSKYMLIDENVWVNTWASSMRASKNTNSLYSIKTFEDYKTYVNRLPDGDEDGLPDYFEINGMITNTGKIIYTNPEKKDSDDDGLTDGEEMGIITLTEPIFERSPFFNYVQIWYAEMGLRYWEFMYFKMESDPNKLDSDEDGANDKIDYTPNTANQEINYIIYYNDANFPAIGSLLSSNRGLWGNKEEYEKWFKDHDMKFETFEVNDSDEYFCFWAHMCFHCKDFKNVTSKNYELKVEYRKVRNLIIIFHGDPNQDAFILDRSNGAKIEQYGVNEEDIEKTTAGCTRFEIDNVDIQCCYAAKDANGNGKSIASVIVANDKIKKVYASNGPMKFDPAYKINYTPYKNCNIYVFYKDKDGKILTKRVGTQTSLGVATEMMFWEK